MTTKGHCESSLGSFDEYSAAHKRLSTLRPSHLTWAVSPPVGSCRLQPPSPFILHSLICRVLLLLLLLLLLLRHASDLRNCTSYFGACMWVWYCRPPIGAHFHPTPQPPPVHQQLGEKAHLRTVAAVLANATAT